MVKTNKTPQQLWRLFSSQGTIFSTPPLSAPQMDELRAKESFAFTELTDDKLEIQGLYYLSLNSRQDNIFWEVKIQPWNCINHIFVCIFAHGNNALSISTFIIGLLFFRGRNMVLSSLSFALLLLFFSVPLSFFSTILYIWLQLLMTFFF